MDELLIKLVQGGIGVGVLVWIVLYFKGEIKEYKAQVAAKDAEIKELNLVVRDMQKEGIEVAIKITGVVEELTDYIKKKP